MKEYICKDELLKRKRDINLANVPFNFIDICPTVTKADICREFAYKFTSKLIYNVENGHATTNGIYINKAIDDLLAEMENEE